MIHRTKKGGLGGGEEMREKESEARRGGRESSSKNNNCFATAFSQLFMTLNLEINPHNMNLVHTNQT